MPEPDFYWRQGDTRSVLERGLTDEDGNPVDLTGAAVTFRMRPIYGGSVVGGTATAPTPASGTAVFTPGTAVTADSGLYLAEWEVIFSGGAIQTFPNGGYMLVMVTKDL